MITLKEPTCNLRFNKTIVEGKPRFTLQQSWVVKVTGAFGVIASQTMEWRDVETVENGT